MNYAGQRVSLITDASYYRGQHTSGEEPYLSLQAGHRGTIRYVLEEEGATGVLWDGASCEEINNDRIIVIPLENEKEAMQACFSKAAAGLRKQWWQRSGMWEGAHFNCYWHVGGKKCGIGHLLDFDKVSRHVISGVEQSDTTAVALRLFDPYIQSYLDFNVDSPKLLTLLHLIMVSHDDGTSPRDMKELLMLTAKKMDLDSFLVGTMYEEPLTIRSLSTGQS
jgi:hypothetical protein